jgi:hypothetical protein
VGADRRVGLPRVSGQSLSGFSTLRVGRPGGLDRPPPVSCSRVRSGDAADYRTLRCTRQ